MKTGLSKFLATTALGAPIFFGATVTDALAKDIGKVAAVNPSMDGTPPTSTIRRLSLGSDVLQNERIETSDDGSGQLLFLDQTSLSIAPRSDLVLDKYVYDPDRQSGEIALTLTKGVLRLIGGRITKRRDGIIRTPTATIGVRGGLALVIVDPDGRTRVCHVAGEYTKVNADAGGEIVLSRPNACAVVEAGLRAVFDGLIESGELVKIYREIEGTGNGGQRLASDSIDTADVSRVNSSEKRGPNDAPVSTSGHSFVPTETSLDEDRNRQDDDVRLLVVQVPTPQLEQEPAVPSTEPEQTPAAPPPPTSAPIVTGLTGASVINQAGNGAGGNTFFQVLQGSLIGQSSDGSEVRIPVPDTGGVSDAVFDTDNLLSNLNFIDAEFTATGLAPGSGLFEFTLGDEAFDPDTGEQIGGSTSSVLGDIQGVAFSDPSEQFTYVEFVDSAEESTGIAIFGNPTAGQSQFAAGDATLIDVSGTTGGDTVPGLSGSSQFVAVINPDLLSATLVNGIPNTVEGFRVQPNLILHDVRGDEPLRGQTPFFMVGNQGFASYERLDTSIDAGSQINGTDLVGGGKWLNGALYIGATGAGGVQESELFIFADDIKSFDGSGPIIAGGSFFSSFEVFDDPEVGPLPSVSAGTSHLGTVEDAGGNTVFGADNRYMALSHVHRAGAGVGDSIPAPFSNDAGTTTSLLAFDTSPASDGTSTFFDRSTRDNEDFNALLARDASLDQTVTNPLPLASSRTQFSTFYDSPGTVRRVDVFDRGFAAGMAVCGEGQCGDVDNFNNAATGLTDEITEFSGSYSVRTMQNDNFSITFSGRELTIGNDPFDSPTESFDTSNSVDVAFSVTSTGSGDVIGAANGVTQTSELTYDLSAGGATSGYIDDNRFAATGESTQTLSDGGSETHDVTATLGVISTGPVGPGVADNERFAGISNLRFRESVAGSPAARDVDPELLNPEFARWGWWSAELSGVPFSDDSGTRTRTDIVHLGNWVAGIRSDPFLDDIPFAGLAEYQGFAVGTQVNLDSFDRQIVGGSFALSFDFATRSGNFNLNIADAGINQTVPVSGFDTFAGRGLEGNRITDINGAFLANPSAEGLSGFGATDGVAGVAGTFESTDVSLREQTTGVFGGDRTNYLPGGRLNGGLTGSDTIRPGPGTLNSPGTTISVNRIDRGN